MTYRLYFWAAGRIVGRQDFDAEDDCAASAISAQLFDACSDKCEAYDLWSGQRRVPVGSPPLKRVSLDELSAIHQETIVEVEEAISRSQWSVAQSRRLLAKLDEDLHARVGATGAGNGFR
jgi:hypothetical protein